MTRPLVAVVLMAVLGGCGHVGAHSKHMLELGRSLTADLERQHAATGTYPHELDPLPAYRALSKRQRQMFVYEQTETGFRLELSHGPCINHCVYEQPYDPATGRGGSWVCHRAC